MLSTINPPMTGPRIGPRSIGTPTTDITRPIRRGPAVCASTVMATGMIIPPPTPWSTRKKISMSAEPASPHNADPRPNSVTDTIQIRFDPKRSVIHPASGMTIANESR